MIVDANNMIVGRLASFVAKQALQGNVVDVINAEKAIFTGSKKNVYDKYKTLVDKGTKPQKGPFISRREDLFLRRIIRGMLPYKQDKGMQAYKRVKCHVGVPKDFQEKEKRVLKEADIKKAKTIKYIRVNELCKLLGRKVQ